MEKYIVIANVKGKKKAEAIAAINGKSKEEANEIASGLRNDMNKCAPNYKIFKNIKVVKMSDFNKKSPKNSVVVKESHLDFANNILCEYGHNWYEDDEEIENLEKTAYDKEYGDVDDEVSVADISDDVEDEIAISPKQVLDDVRAWRVFLDDNPSFDIDQATQDSVGGKSWPLFQRMVSYYEDGLITDDELGVVGELVAPVSDALSEDAEADSDIGQEYKLYAKKVFDGVKRGVKSLHDKIKSGGLGSFIGPDVILKQEVWGKETEQKLNVSVIYIEGDAKIVIFLNPQNEEDVSVVGYWTTDRSNKDPRKNLYTHKQFHGYIKSDSDVNNIIETIVDSYKTALEADGFGKYFKESFSRLSKTLIAEEAAAGEDVRIDGATFKAEVIEGLPDVSDIKSIIDPYFSYVIKNVKENVPDQDKDIDVKSTGKGRFANVPGAGMLKFKFKKSRNDYTVGLAIAPNANLTEEQKRYIVFSAKDAILKFFKNHKSDDDHNNLQSVYDNILKNNGVAEYWAYFTRDLGKTPEGCPTLGIRVYKWGDKEDAEITEAESTELPPFTAEEIEADPKKWQSWDGTSGGWDVKVMSKNGKSYLVVEDQSGDYSYLIWNVVRFLPANFDYDSVSGTSSEHNFISGPGVEIENADEPNWSLPKSEMGMDESHSWLSEASHYIVDYQEAQEEAIAEVITECKTVKTSVYESYSTIGANSLMTEYGHDWYEDDEELSDLENKDAELSDLQEIEPEYETLSSDELSDLAKNGDDLAVKELIRRRRGR